VSYHVSLLGIVEHDSLIMFCWGDRRSDGSYNWPMLQNHDRGRRHISTQNLKELGKWVTSLIYPTFCISDILPIHIRCRSYHSQLNPTCLTLIITASKVTHMSYDWSCFAFYTHCVSQLKKTRNNIWKRLSKLVLTFSKQVQNFTKQVTTASKVTCMITCDLLITIINSYCNK
jgi:hypothetical protein